MEPGLGKTLTALQAWRRGGSRSLVVVAPVSALGVWHSELSDLGYDIPYLPATGAAKVRVIRWSIPYALSRIIVINYEALLNKEVLLALHELGDFTLILDESQRIKTPSAKRSRAATALSKDRQTFILSGTPVTRNLLDLYGQFKAIDPTIFDTMSFSKFKQRYAVMGGYGNYQVVGYRDIPDLEARIAPYTYALRKEDALDLPPQVDQVVPVTAHPAQWRQYRELANGGLWLGEPVDNPLVRALRLQQLAGLFKIDHTLDQVQTLLEAGEKVVVFYKFLEEGRQLMSRLPKGTLHLHGMVSASRRGEMVDIFQNTPLSGVFLAQIDAGAVAITLTASSNVVYHSMSWSYESATQSRDRVHRVGQTRHTTYRYMTFTGPDGQTSIDTLIANALTNKETIASMVMDNPELLRTD